MNITQSPWSAFESLEVLKNYSKDEIELFVNQIFDTNDEETILTDFCALNDYLTVIEWIIKQIRPTVAQIVLNQEKGFEFAGYKFIYRAQTKYDYSSCQLWKLADDSVRANAEYRKQIEEVCKTGGKIGDNVIEKVPAEVVDNFAMSKLKGNV